MRRFLMGWALAFLLAMPSCAFAADKAGTAVIVFDVKASVIVCVILPNGDFHSADVTLPDGMLAIEAPLDQVAAHSLEDIQAYVLKVLDIGTDKRNG